MSVKISDNIASYAPSRGVERMVWLDVLRFVAIMLVLGAHMKSWPTNIHPWIQSIGSVWKIGGWAGVDLFFVLSGFLVSGLIFSEIKKTGSLQIGRFLIRRGFKIYPAFWVVVAFTIAYRVRLSNNWVAPRKIFGELFFLQNYVGRLWDTHWSLAVEEHFYLLIAAAVATIQRLSRSPLALTSFQYLPAAFFCVALFCFGVRWYNAVHFVFDVQVHLMPTHARIDSLLFGGLLAWVVHSKIWTGAKMTPAQRWLMILGGVVLYVPLFIFPMTTVWWVLVFGVIGAYLGGGLLVMAGLGLTITWPWPLKFVAFIGAHSYSIYLWHYPFLVWINPYIGRHMRLGDIWWLEAMTYLLGSILFGIGMAKLIERPMLLLRERLFPAFVKPSKGVDRLDERLGISN